MKKATQALLTVALLLPNSMVFSQTTANPLTGIWELNFSKLKFVPAASAFKSQTRNYQVVGHQEKGVHKGIDAQGKPNRIALEGLMA
jgi:hypothetical protein